MLQYKVVPVPAKPTKVSKKDYYNAFSRGWNMDSAEEALSDVSVVISNYAKQGWTLHSISWIPMRIRRPKTVFELLFGWIPILGGMLFPEMEHAKSGREVNLYTITFVSETAK